jgi:hypothetical protein
MVYDNVLLHPNKCRCYVIINSVKMYFSLRHTGEITLFAERRCVKDEISNSI